MSINPLRETFAGVWAKGTTAASAGTTDRDSLLALLLRSGATRPARFAAVGALAGVTQLSLLWAFTREGFSPVAANAVAFLLAAQLNFWASQAFTWSDRTPTGAGRTALALRWLAFHASIAGTAAVNLAVFAAARTLLHDELAAALGIAVAAVLNYFVGDRFVFGLRTRREAPPPVLLLPVRSAEGGPRDGRHGR